MGIPANSSRAGLRTARKAAVRTHSDRLALNSPMGKATIDEPAAIMNVPQIKGTIPNLGDGGVRPQLGPE